MKISVVTISFNQRRFLEQAILSVLNQKDVEIEYIVVDPGSSDGSRDVINKYRKDLSAVVLEPDRGPADGLNRGLSLATGDLFYFLNSDDLVAPGGLKAAARQFEKNPSLAVVYGSGLIIDETNQIVRRVIPPKMTPFRYAYGQSFILQQSAVMTTSSLRAVGGFNPENRTCWDGEAFLEIALSGGRFKRVTEDIGYFRIYSGSITGSGMSRVQYRNDHLRLFSKVMGRPWNGGRDQLVARGLGLFSQLTDPGRLVARVFS